MGKVYFVNLPEIGISDKTKKGDLISVLSDRGNNRSFSGKVFVSKIDGRSSNGIWPEKWTRVQGRIVRNTEIAKRIYSNIKVINEQWILIKE